MKTIISFLLMASSFSCGAQSTQNSLLDEVRKVIEASNAIFSDLANKNDGSILSRYTEDACLLPPGAPSLCGYQNIVKFFKDGPKVNSKFMIQRLYGDGREYVTEESLYELTDLAGKKIDDGRVIVIWKKTKDGWKMYRDMFSSNHPPKI